MTSLRNIPISDSAVYRSIHQSPQGEPLQLGTTITTRTSRAAAEEEASSKWAFLKRLLEIEEAHDKRRRAKERQERALKQATLKPLTVTPVPSAGGVNNKKMGLQRSSGAAERKEQLDHTAKWISGQVLTSAAPNTETSDSSYRNPASRHRLPSVFDHLESDITAPEEQESDHHQHQLVRAKAQSVAGYSTTDNQISETNPRNEHSQTGFYNHDQRASVSSLRNSSHYSLASSEQIFSINHDDHDGSARASLSNFRRTPSRPTTAPKKHRQLRLPPILLPRVYTVQPRPLKALEFPTPTKMPGPITEAQWEDLHDCRYIRHTTSRRSLNL